MMNKSVTYVEFGFTGHRSLHVRYMGEAFKMLNDNWLLNVWVSQNFLTRHTELVEQLSTRNRSDRNGGRIVFKVLEDVADKIPGSSPIYFESNDSEFDIVCRCVERDNSVACFVPHLEPLVKDIALSRPGACSAKISGILWRPFLHYRQFVQHDQAPWPGRMQWLKSYLLYYLLCHRSIVAEILVEDPYAPQYYNRMLRTPKVRFLTDFLPIFAPLKNARKHFNLPQDRKIFLMFGSFGPHKGVVQLLDAAQMCARNNSDFSKQTAFVFAGEIHAFYKENFYSLVSGFSELYPDIPIFILDRYMTDIEINTIVSTADIVCIPYIRHVGTSGNLALAAWYERLALGSNFGLVGELIQQNNLGVICDPMNIPDLAAAIVQVLEKDRQMSVEQRRSLKDFARRNFSGKIFGEEICASITRTAGLG